MFNLSPFGEIRHKRPQEEQGNEIRTRKRRGTSLRRMTVSWALTVTVLIGIHYADSNDRGRVQEDLRSHQEEIAVRPPWYWSDRLLEIPQQHKKYLPGSAWAVRSPIQKRGLGQRVPEEFDVADRWNPSRCDLIRRSSLYSPECGATGAGEPFPLLVTGMGRTGTSFFKVCGLVNVRPQINNASTNSHDSVPFSSSLTGTSFTFGG